MTQSNAKKALFAKGRLKPGVMNKTEAKYAAYLELLKQAGEVLWYAFEGMKFKLADACFYEPDFAVMLADGSMEMHEVKGAKAIFQDDAKVKIKVAAQKYPFKFKAIFPLKNNGWEVIDY